MSIISKLRKAQKYSGAIKPAKKSRQNTTGDNFYAYSFDDPEYRAAIDEYFDTADKIRRIASTLYQLQIVDGERMDDLISLCYKNIEQFDKCVFFWNKYHESLPLSSEAFKRLAIIYDRQEVYDKELQICLEALKRGLNHSNMHMQSRAAKCIKKLGITPSPEIESLLLS